MPETRQERPTQHLLDSALKSAGYRTGLWIVGKRMDLPNSTIFPLTLKVDGAPILHAYYKNHRFDNLNDKRLKSSIHVIRNSPSLIGEYVSMGGLNFVEMPEILARDTEELSEITTEIKGSPIGNYLRHISPKRWIALLEVYKKLGSAVCLIEKCGCHSITPELENTLSLISEFEYKVDRLGNLFTQVERKKLLELLYQNYFDANREGSVLSHADLQGGNILVSGNNVGVIDSLWGVRWKGFDIANHASALEYQIPSLKFYARRLIESMLDGYGDKTLPSSPGWKLAAIWREIHLAFGVGIRFSSRYRRLKAISSLRKKILNNP